MKGTSPSARAIVLAFVLSLAWLFWSGIYKPALLWLGAVSCVLSVYLAHRIGFLNTSSGFHLVPKMFRYGFWLLREILKSSVDVTRIVLNPTLPIQPTLVRLDAEPKGPLGQVALSTAITLSPGTVVLDLFDDKIRVHSLTEAGVSSVQEANLIAAKLTDR